ncbi:hypothetical protein AVEN_151828-1 [Araneus ventricosus]|uniref:Uncharacterized protein n=1 Tax=Araneus ventricosus TaxID=182803 RepID=A0A4Y2MSY5_ARAVE|nr:hypothetical protein AVEN_151828-1 [Araneus ventricosus]
MGLASTRCWVLWPNKTKRAFQTHTFIDNGRHKHRDTHKTYGNAEITSSSITSVSLQADATTSPPGGGYFSLHLTTRQIKFQEFSRIFTDRGNPEECTVLLH